jgi:hypothetical protein
MDTAIKKANEVIVNVAQDKDMCDISPVILLQSPSADHSYVNVGEDRVIGVPKFTPLIVTPPVNR